ncbi:MAG: insulinase family protein [Staphylococcus sp.]|nr:insulinase family protein [Staphylococcus sp.]
MVNRTIAPPVYSFGPMILSPADSYTLPNGITIHIESGSEIEVSRLTVALPGGEAESSKPGLAACAGTLLIEGSQRLTGEEIANTLEYNGAWVNTSVSTHYTSVTLSSLNDKFDELLPIFAEMILCPSFPHDATGNILQRQAARLDIEHEKVSFLVDEAIRPMAYGVDNPLARTENAAEIRNFTTEELSTFHYSRLNPKGIHVFFSGNITEKMRSSLDNVFSRFPARNGIELCELRFPFEYNVQCKRVDIMREHAQQSAIKIMIPAVGRQSADFVPLRATVTALGGYFGSRLMLNIREEKGLTYGISAVLLGYPTHSFITITTQTDSSTKDEVIRLIVDELEKMKDHASYSDDEMKRLSRFLLSNLATVLDTPFSRMDYTQTHIYASTPIDYFEQQERLARNLSADILAEMARKYFNTGHMLIATAGN